VSFASAAGAKRELLGEGLHPFQIGEALVSSETVRSRQNASGRGIGSPPGLPRNPATAARSTRFSWYAIVIIAPKSSVRRMRELGMFSSVLRLGVRPSAGRS
jgi:hypothetical protein